MTRRAGDPGRAVSADRDRGRLVRRLRRATSDTLPRGAVPCAGAALRRPTSSAHPDRRPRRIRDALPRPAGREVGRSAPRKRRLPRARAAANFVRVRGDKALERITRAEALECRGWWQDRVEAERLNPETANEGSGHLSEIFRTVSDLLGLGLDNPLARLRLAPAAPAEVPPFSTAWLRGTLLAPGALGGLDDEARDALVVMVKTGARPSELLGLLPEKFVLGDPIPHISVRRREGRTLESEQSRRLIPLAGVSLEAARRIVARRGFRLYALEADSWSAAVTRYLAEKKLRETPRRTAYSLRHSFEDRLIEAKADERIRIESMGQKYKRPKYGRGGRTDRAPGGRSARPGAPAGARPVPGPARPTFLAQTPSCRRIARPFRHFRPREEGDGGKAAARRLFSRKECSIETRDRASQRVVGSSLSRSQSPSTETASVVRTMTIAGESRIHGARAMYSRP